VKCWGYDSDGELGNNDNSLFYNTAQSTGLTGIQSMAASYDGMCVVSTGGKAYCWGDNASGELGDGTTTNRLVPTAVSSITTTGASAAAGGLYANCILLKTGGVKCFGFDTDGNLDLGSVTGLTYSTPQAAKITGVGSLSGSGVDTDEPNCAVIAVGGAVKCWGASPIFTLGDGATYTSGSAVTVSGISNALQVAPSQQASCIVLKSGALWCWGDNSYGQLGDGTNLSVNTPIASTLTGGVVGVAVGEYHTCVLKTGGVVQCIGYDFDGELGDGPSGNYGTGTPTLTWQTPIASGAVAVGCGFSHTCALMASGDVYCWGDNTYGQLGDGSSVANNPTPVLVSSF
jgi:alpha-tubulin suppressor-like RCC1 family protein